MKKRTVKKQTKTANLSKKDRNAVFFYFTFLTILAFPFIYLVFSLFALIYSHSLAFPFGADFPVSSGTFTRFIGRAYPIGESKFLRSENNRRNRK